MTVMWTIGELGLEYQRHNLGGSFGGNSDPEYIAINPNMVVPAINDNGKVLWESNVIARYLAAVYGKGVLWAEDPYRRALAEQWMDWTKTTFYGGFMPVFWNMIRKPADKCDSVTRDAGIKTTAGLMQILDRHLCNRPFVAGDQLSLGDIALGPMMYRYFNLDIERPNLANVDAWYQRLCQRPAYQKHVMIPFGKSFDEWGPLEKAGADIQ